MQFRVAPKAVCRTMLGNLSQYKPLSESEEAEALSALDSLNMTARVLAQISRKAIQAVEKEL
jgi:hypothetical protein